MSVIYYCDAEGCTNKATGQAEETGWSSPDGWQGLRVDENTYDACCVDHVEKILAAKLPPEEEEEETSEDT